MGEVPSCFGLVCDYRLYCAKGASLPPKKAVDAVGSSRHSIGHLIRGSVEALIAGNTGLFETLRSCMF